MGNRADLCVGVAHEELILLLDLVPCLWLSRVLDRAITHTHLDIWREHLHYLLVDEVCFWISDGCFMLTCPRRRGCLDYWSLLVLRRPPSEALVVWILLRSLHRWSLWYMWDVMYRLNINAKVVHHIVLDIVILKYDVFDSNLVHLRWISKAVIAFRRRFCHLIFDIALLLDSVKTIGCLLKLEQLLDDLILQSNVGHGEVSHAEERLERNILNSRTLHVDFS